MTKKLPRLGFLPNPYDTCVVNKELDEKKYIVLCQVDDIKISHIDIKVVDIILEIIEEEYGRTAPLNVTRDKMHKYLGTTLELY